MASVAAILSILVDANTSKARAELVKLNKDLTKSEAKAKNIRVAAGAAGLALGGTLALGARAGWKELEQSSKVAAQTAAVLKSTGGAANITAKQVDTLSNSLLKKSGIDDEVIKSGINMLLTFRDIRNEVGKNNDILNQATKLTLDLSVAMGLDMKQAALQVGKALNDPERGMARLQRIGVTFTKQQVEQAKALQESGNRVGAQKIILGELAKEFGGSAAARGKTFTGQMDTLRESMNNLAASVTAILIPSIKSLTGPMQVVADFFSKHTTTAKVLTGVLVVLAATLLTVSVATKAYAAAAVIATGAQYALSGAYAAFNLILAANPILLVVAALAALAIGLVLAYKKVKPFHDAVQGTFNWIKNHWPLLLGILTGPIGLAVLAIVRNWAKIASATRSAWNTVKNIITGALGATVGAITGFAGRFTRAASGIANAFKGGLRGLVSWAGTLGHAIIDAIVSAIKSAPGAITDAITSIVPSGVRKVLKKAGGIAHDILPGLASGGLVTHPMFMVGEESPRHPEYVISTNPRDRKRMLPLLAQAAGKVGGFARGGIAAMTSAASRINSKHYPYLWGGGHNSSFSGPYDCSGAVSAVLHAGGVLSSPLVSGQFANWGEPGPGKVTLYANSGHVYMRIGSKWFGTSGSNPGGGAGWFPGAPRAGFAVRHVPEKLLNLGKRGSGDGIDKGVRGGKAGRMVAGKTGGGGFALGPGTPLGSMGQITGGSYVPGGSGLANTSVPASGGDFTDTGEDPNQPLIDALEADRIAQEAAAEAARQQTEALNALKGEVATWNNFSASVANVTSFQAIKALADSISGQIAGQAGARAATASWGNTVRL
jgi:hypothetical protein